jgi:hypothetical protein
VASTKGAERTAQRCVRPFARAILVCTRKHPHNVPANANVKDDLRDLARPRNGRGPATVPPVGATTLKRDRVPKWRVIIESNTRYTVLPAWAGVTGGIYSTQNWRPWWCGDVTDAARPESPGGHQTIGTSYDVAHVPSPRSQLSSSHTPAQRVSSPRASLRAADDVQARPTTTVYDV